MIKMRNGKLKFTILFILLILILLGYGAFLMYNKKNNVKNFIKQDLPVLTEAGKTNLPGKLIGPQGTTKAKTLSVDKILALTNEYRAKEGLGPLETNEFLKKAAETKVRDMFDRQYFEHISPAGVTPAQLVLDSGYNYKITGENLALGDFKDEKDLVDAWMASPGHRENIMGKDYTQIGLAVGLEKFEDRITWLAVQEFGKPAPDCPSPDKNLLDQIEDKKAEYESLTNELNTRIKEYEDATKKANELTKKGNDTFSTTHDRAKAQIYWAEADQYQKEANDAFREAKSLETQLNVLYNQINTEVNKYNTEANNYNACAQK